MAPDSRRAGVNWSTWPSRTCSRNASRTGTYPPDGRLPAELELVAEFGSSRESVRRAVEELRKRGLVETVKGKGSFVVPPEERNGPRLAGMSAASARLFEAARQCCCEHSPGLTHTDYRLRTRCKLQ